MPHLSPERALSSCQASSPLELVLLPLIRSNFFIIQDPIYFCLNSTLVIISKLLISSDFHSFSWLLHFLKSLRSSNWQWPPLTVFFFFYPSKYIFGCHHFKIRLLFLLLLLNGSYQNHQGHLWNEKGNGNPLQYSCLENPRDRVDWWAAVYGVTQSWARLKRLSSSSRLFCSPNYIHQIFIKHMLLPWWLRW